MAVVTAEALEGFECVSGRADPSLVQCIEETDECLHRYIDEQLEFH